jgi:hypothetical protein
MGRRAAKEKKVAICYKKVTHCYMKVPNCRHRRMQNAKRRPLHRAVDRV